MSMQNISLTGNVHQSVDAMATGLTTTAEALGTGIDTTGFRSLLAILAVGAVTGTNETLDMKLQESSVVGSGYTDITGATFTQVTDTPSPVTDAQFIELDLLPRKAFIRGLGTIAGTTPVFPTNLIFVLYNAVDSAYAGTADSTTVT